MAETTKVEPKTAQGFSEAYKKLCDEWGFRLVITPAYVARDDGTWSTVLQVSVGEMPKEK